VSIRDQPLGARRTGHRRAHCARPLPPSGVNALRSQPSWPTRRRHLAAIALPLPTSPMTLPIEGRRTSGDQSLRLRKSITFGPFELFVEERLLEKDGKPVPLGSRSLQILAALVGHTGEVLSNSSLIAEVWRDVAVAEAAVRVHISALRKALGDGVGGARYITNIPGRGYCFVARVTRTDPGSRSLGTFGSAEMR
jgi:DNA-binding winged helix-turn-helix (wHTH) protein